MTERATNSELSGTGKADLGSHYLDRQEVLAHIAAGLKNPPVGIVLLEVLVTIDAIGGPIDHKLIESAITERIQKVAAPHDLVLASGLDRLTIIRSGLTAPAEAEGFALQIQDGLHSPILIGEGRVSCQSAIGVAVSQAGDTAEPLIRYAEHALGDARMLGGDIVVAFDDQDRDLLSLGPE